MSIKIYSSTVCGFEMRKDTVSMQNVVSALTKKDIPIIYIDKDPEEKKLMFSKTDLRGVFPLLFCNDEFIGTYDDVRDLSEQGLLLDKLK